MTSPSASRPGLGPHVLASGPPAEAVSLADLVAETGPLPADAALECVQRLAERLGGGERSCEPADVLLDDDGEVWFRCEPTATTATAADEPPAGMEPLGRLLMFLVEGRADRGADGLPAPVAGIAGRLFSKNGARFRSYAELARAVRTARGVEEPPEAARAEPRSEPAEPQRRSAEPVADASEAIARPTEPPAAPPSGSGWIIGVAVAATAAAATAWMLLR